VQLGPPLCKLHPKGGMIRQSEGWGERFAHCIINVNTVWLTNGTVQPERWRKEKTDVKNGSSGRSRYHSVLLSSTAMYQDV